MHLLGPVINERDCCIKNGTYKDKLHEIAPCPRHTAAISEIVVFTIQLKRPVQHLATRATSYEMVLFYRESVK